MTPFDYLLMILLGLRSGEPIAANREVCQELGFCRVVLLDIHEA